MSDWEEVRLKDICTNIQYGYTESASNEVIGPKFLRITDIVNSSIHWSTVPYCKITDSDFKKYQLFKGDIVVARTGNTTGWAKLIRNNINSVFASYLIRFQLNKDVAYSGYVGRLIESDIFKGYVRSIIGGSAQPGANAVFLSDFKLILPPLPTQQKIAKILSNYDDLIENNLKRIKLLEESARLTYEEWFLRFRIDGKKLDIDSESGLPFGWKNVLLSDYIDLLRGHEPGSSAYEEEKTSSNIPFIRVGDLSKRESDIYISKDLSKNKIIEESDILLSLDGSPGMVKFGLSGCYSTGIRRALSKQKNISNIFILNLLNSQYIQSLINAYATGATILHAGSSVKKMRFVLPTNEILDKYNDIEMKKFRSILNLQGQIKFLKEARDILLPRLMTGMIDTDKLKVAV